MNTNVIKQFLIVSCRYLSGDGAVAARPGARKRIAHLIALALSTGISATCLAASAGQVPNTRVLAVTPAAAQNGDAPRSADPAPADPPKTAAKSGHKHKKSTHKTRRKKTRVAASG